MITYSPAKTKSFTIDVILDGKRVGKIKSVMKDGRAPYYYQAGSFCSDHFNTIEEVKRSLESN